MTMQRILLATAALLAVSSPAFSANSKETFESNTNISEGPDGEFSEKTVSTKVDKEGTAHKVEKNVRVEKDSTGNTTKTTTTEKTMDPKGMMNKSTEKTTDTEKMTGDSVTNTHEKKVNGTVTESTTDKNPK